MKVYGIKTCDTCREALKALPDATLVDVRNDDMPEGLLTRALETFGSALVNTRSTTWRGLSEAERARPQQELLIDHPTLMKRPLIEVEDGGLLLGWTDQTRTALGVS